MRGVRMQDRLRVALKRLAICAFAGYLVWNVVWLLRGRLPPSIWSYFTGLPCPTSGVCRSLAAVSHIDFRSAFLFNAFTLPYLYLLCFSGIVLFRQLLRRRDLVLPPLLARAWCLALILGWAAKFVVGREYW